MAAGPRHPVRVFESLAEGVWERNLVTGDVWYSPRYKALLGFEDHELPNTMEAMRARPPPKTTPRFVRRWQARPNAWAKPSA